YRAWDRTGYTQGQQGHPADASGNGGETPFSENTATSHIAVSDVNDAPDLGLLPGPQTINEDTWLDIGPAWGQITDVDSGDEDIQLSVRATWGTLLVDTEVPGGVDPGDVQGNGSGSVTITAPVWAINATLADASGLRYTPLANYNGEETVSLRVDDLGNSGAG